MPDRRPVVLVPDRAAHPPALPDSARIKLAQERMWRPGPQVLVEIYVAGVLAPHRVIPHR